jgi:hypothetical protein
LIPKVFAGTPEPLRIVLTTVVDVRPAALLLIFSPAMADGSNAKDVTSVTARKNLLPFMVHQGFCWGDLSLNL